MNVDSHLKWWLLFSPDEAGESGRHQSTTFPAIQTLLPSCGRFAHDRRPRADIKRWMRLSYRLGAAQIIAPE